MTPLLLELTAQFQLLGESTAFTKDKRFLAD